MKSRISLLRTLAILVVLLTTAGAQAQVTVKGTVIDQENEPVIGATVLEDGTTNGTATDIDGNFTLNVKNNFTSDDIFVMTGDGTYVSNSGVKDRSTTASVFARANYSFDDRYLITATIRGDGSSKFGSNHKWGAHSPRWPSHGASTARNSWTAPWAGSTT